VPARPSGGKGRLSADKTFGSGEGKMKSGARTEAELGLTAFVRNFEFGPYRKENTALHHYKDQLLNVAYRNERRST
jgi:hypothetical protein